MNLLSGEPKKQASDWLKSARLHLEVGQLCEALTSYVTAIGAEAIPASGSKNWGAWVPNCSDTQVHGYTCAPYI